MRVAAAAGDDDDDGVRGIDWEALKSILMCAKYLRCIQMNNHTRYTLTHSHIP